MMYVLSICAAAVGIFLLLCAFFGAPTWKMTQAVHRILYAKEKTEDSFSAFIDKLAVPLSNVLPLDATRLETMQQNLFAANITVPAKLYLCRCIVKSVVLFAITALASIIVKPLLIAAFIMPILVYYSESQKAENQTLRRKQEIEADLPQLVATFTTQLSASRDVVRILQSYLSSANPAMKEELSITISDMESGNYELALTRFETRINSNQVSDVVRGLIGTLRGNDERVYFQMLGYTLKQEQLTRLKKQAQKSVPKLNAASMVLLCGIMVLFIGVLLVDMLGGMEVLF